jgi:hypothetical protein
LIACDSDCHQYTHENREDYEDRQSESSEKVSAASNYTAQRHKQNGDSDENCGFTEGLSEAGAIVADVSDGCGDEELDRDEGVDLADKSFSSVVREGCFSCIVFFL